MRDSYRYEIVYSEGSGGTVRRFVTYATTRSSAIRKTLGAAPRFIERIDVRCLHEVERPVTAREGIA